jgi:hypothetical protein
VTEAETEYFYDSFFVSGHPIETTITHFQS